MAPIVLDATVAGATANSYVTLAAADLYHAAHLYADAWDGASDDRKNRALITATRLLDTWFEWKGEVVGSTQALLWPRIGVPRPNRLLWTGAAWPFSNVHAGIWEATDAIPARIQQATCDWARALLTSDRTADSDTETQGIRRLQAGPISLEFSSSVLAKPIPDAVLVAASLYGQVRSRSGTVTLLRA